MKAQLILLVCAFACVAAQRTCYGVDDSRYDSYCDQNCNAPVPHCPEQFCTCDDASPSPSPAAVPTAQSCESVVGYISDSWCDMMCNAEPVPFCPAMFCTCTTAAPVSDDDDDDDETPMAISAFWDGEDVQCCDEGRRGIYFTETNNLYRQFLDSDTAELCAELGGDPNDIAIDEDGDIWVTSRVSHVLWVVDQNCSSANVAVSWAQDLFAVGDAVAFAAGNVYVSGPSGIYEVVVNSAKEVVSFTNTGWTAQAVGAMDAYNDCIYFTTFNKDVQRICPATQTTPTTFLSANEFNLPDVQGITVTSCGLFVSVTDANQVWRCDGVDMTEATQCARVCEIEGTDTDSCFNLDNPWGLATGCCCDIYAVGRFSGTILAYDGLSNATFQAGEVIQSGLFHPKGIAFFADRPPCDSGPSCGSEPPTPSLTPSTTASSSLTASNTPSPSPSPTSSQPTTLVVSYCPVGDGCQATAVAVGDTLDVTVTASEATTLTTATCSGGLIVTLSTADNLVFTGQGTVPALATGTEISCEISNAGTVVDANLTTGCATVLVDATPPSPTLTVGLGPGVSTCVGVREAFSVTVTSDSADDTLVSLACGAAGALSPVQGVANSSLPGTFVVNNTLSANSTFVCEAVVSDAVCNEGTASDSLLTCGPIARLVGDVQRPTQAGSATNAISVGVVSTQLLECVDIQPGVQPNAANCRTFPEEINRVFDVPTIVLQLLINGTTLQSVDPAGVSPVIRLNPLVPVSDPTMCFIYAEAIYYDVDNSRTAICSANPAQCISTSSTITEACTGGFLTANKEFEILPRIKNSFSNSTEANLLDTTDVISITANICPGNTVNEYAVSYVHYFGNGFENTADKPSLSPRPTYIDANGVERAPAICIDRNNHPELGNIMNTNKGSIICLEDPDLVVSNVTTQLAGFKPPPGEVMVVGDIVPISSSGDNKDSKACPFRAVEGGSDPGRYCGTPTERKCIQFTQP